MVSLTFNFLDFTTGSIAPNLRCLEISGGDNSLRAPEADRGRRLGRGRRNNGGRHAPGFRGGSFGRKWCGKTGAVR